MKTKSILHSFIIILLFLIFNNDASAQTARGKILDAESRKPVANATIGLNGVVTESDAKGNFEFKIAPGNYLLTIKHVGYEAYSTSITVPLKSALTISLSPIKNQLEDVIVSTGYQTISKERATGSFSYVDQKSFNQQITPSVLERLEGVLPALSVDRRTNGASMMIRGLSTLRNDRAPLIVIDQFPYEGDIDNINPADVESVTVLKDAAAASIWGAKASNGVIVVTTKKAKFNDAWKLEANVNTTILSKPDLFYKSQISGADLVTNEQMLFSKGYYTSRENTSARPAQSPVVELLIAARDGKINAATLQQQLDFYKTQDVRTNYADAFYEKAINRQYNVSMQGGTEKMKWRLFSGYDDNVSALGTTNKRFNLKVVNDWHLLKGLDGGLDLNYNQTDAKNGRVELASLTTASGVLPSYYVFKDANGNELPVMYQYSTRYLATAGGGNLLNWNYYPISEPERAEDKSRIQDIFANIRLSYTILNGLKLSANYQHERQLTNGTDDYSVDSYYARNLINLYTQISGTTVTRPIPLGTILDLSQQALIVNNGRAQVNYDRTLDDFAITFLAGCEMRNARGTSNQFRTYGLDHETLTSVSVDYANAYKSFLTGGNIYIPNGISHSGTTTRYVSAYANGAISYKNRYTLSGSARRDASNLFGVATNNKWNPLWSAGLAWLISDEAFAQGLPYLRLRATYGSSGNTDTRLAAVTTIVYGASSPYTQTGTATFSNYANPDLRWETTNTLNIAVDFKALKNRLSGSVDYYIKRSKDLIGTEPIDYTTGIGSTVTRNAAKIEAKGLDIELKSLNLNGAFRWSTDFFINLYRDKILEYYLSSRVGSNFINGNSTLAGVIGRPVYSVSGYKWAGLNGQNGNPQGYLNGVVSENYASLVGTGITVDDLDYVGPAFPSSTGALGNTFEWKNFNLNFRLGFKFGAYFRRPALNYTSLFTNRNGDAEYADRWQKAGDELNTVVPSEVYPAVGNRDSFYTSSTATIVSGDLIRLQYIGFGYTFTKQAVKALPFKSASIQFIANQLGLLWKANDYNLDPDYPSMTPSKTYSISLKVNL